ncbi:MAG: RHS repeat-associated core domain-containing protein [Bacillales bacterium]|nr:RHS repeat-associated core domain-containing protein [Bacillales bacterium]
MRENTAANIKNSDVTVYVRGLTLLYVNDGNEIYYHFNAHGDVVVLTDEDGTKEKSYSYNAFGVEEDPSALDDNPFRYCGEYFDKVNEKIYLRARYYDAGQGRFTQEDPIRDGSNWYSYCGGNPVMFVDPNGLDSWVFYDAEAFSKQAQTESKILQDTYDTEVHLIEINSLEDFLFAWYFMTIFDGSIDGVSMLFHGTPYTLYLGQNEDGTYDQLTSSVYNITPSGMFGYYIGNLPKASIKSINLMSCNAGHLDLIYSNEAMQDFGFYHNIAVEFLVTQDVSIVYGMDGNLSYTNFFGNYYPRLSWNQDGFKNCAPTRNFFGKRKPLGKIAFYLKQDGSVGYFGMWKNF